MPITPREAINAAGLRDTPAKTRAEALAQARALLQLIEDNEDWDFLLTASATKPDGEGGATLDATSIGSLDAWNSFQLASHRLSLEYDIDLTGTIAETILTKTPTLN